MCLSNHYGCVRLICFTMPLEYTSDTFWYVIYISMLHKISAYKIASVGIGILETIKDVTQQ